MSDAAHPAPSTRPTRVQLLVTCLVDRIFPETGMAVARTLERLGIEVIVPPAQTCCGQPAFNAGYTDDARAMARHTIDVFLASPDPIVIPSGSCGDMVIHQYAALFKNDPVYEARARALASRTYEFTQFLVDVLGVTDVGAVSSERLAYHACCHGLRGLNLRDEPRALIAAVGGAGTCTLAESDVCCGFGGLFSVKMADVSSAMLDRKLDRIEESGADAVVVTDVSCGMHMAGGLRRRGSRVSVRHIADVLAPGRPAQGDFDETAGTDTARGSRR
jgi:L-lactate dehydrogenase complex protein LldE